MGEKNTVTFPITNSVIQSNVPVNMPLVNSHALKLAYLFGKEPDANLTVDYLSNNPFTVSKAKIFSGEDIYAKFETVAGKKMWLPVGYTGIEHEKLTVFLPTENYGAEFNRHYFP